MRKSRLNNYLPIDDNISFHKLVGQVMFGLAVVHTLAHFLNYTTLQSSFMQNLFVSKAGLSGFLLLCVFALMWATAQTPIRKGGHFELFYLAHLGYVLWFIFALIHGPVFWQWALLPILGFAIEQIYRWSQTREPTYVANASLLPSKVLSLEIDRPQDFDYQPGDYLFVKCPGVSKFEWPPFTITSAPEQESTLTLHIRAAGSWTGKINTLFQTQREQLIDPGNPKTDPDIAVYLDGPYGTPSTHIFESRVAVLIGAGIGVPPSHQF